MRAFSSTMVAPLMYAAPWFVLFTWTIAAVCGVPLRGNLEKILQHQMAVLGRNALGMKLDAVDRQRRVRKAHDQVVRLGGDSQIAWHARAIDDQRVIARRLERPVDATKDPGSPVFHLR